MKGISYIALLLLGFVIPLGWHELIRNVRSIEFTWEWYFAIPCSILWLLVTGMWLWAVALIFLA